MHANPFSVCFPLEMHVLLIDRNRGFGLRFYPFVIWFPRLPIAIDFIGSRDLLRPFFLCVPLLLDISDFRLWFPLSDQRICWGPICVCTFDISNFWLRFSLSDRRICWGLICVCPFVIAICDLRLLYRNVELFIMFFKGTLCIFQKALQNESFTSDFW